MAITELFVKPQIAGDSGTGTDVDPYGDLQFCLDSETFDTTNGTRINITVGDGTAEILAAALDTASNFFAGGGTSATAPLIMQGCKDESPLVAGDGDWATQAGIGRIDCNNKTLFVTVTLDYVTLRHLEIFGRAGGGYFQLIIVDAFCHIAECELHTHSGSSPLVRMGGRCMFNRNHAHGITSGQSGILVAFGSTVRANYFDFAGGVSQAIDLSNLAASATRNIIRLASGNADGINMNGSAVRVYGNSI